MLGDALNWLFKPLTDPWFTEPEKPRQRAKIPVNEHTAETLGFLAGTVARREADDMDLAEIERRLAELDEKIERYARWDRETDELVAQINARIAEEGVAEDD